MKTTLALLVTLVASLSADAASTLRELLVATQANPTKVTERQIEDHLVEQMRVSQPDLQVFAKAWRLSELEEPGCGRYAVELSAASSSIARKQIAMVELDLCQKGLPPVPPGLRKRLP